MSLEAGKSSEAGAAGAGGGTDSTLSDNLPDESKWDMVTPSGGVTSNSVPLSNVPEKEDAAVATRAIVGFSARRTSDTSVDPEMARRKSIQRKERKLKLMIENIEKATPQRTMFMKVIPGSTRWLRHWTVMISLFLMYLCTSIPLLLAFGYPEKHSGGWIVILLCDIVAECVFIVDIFLNFHMGFTDNSGTEIQQPLRIRQRYVESWMLLDLIALAPLDMGQTTVGTYLRVLKMLRFFPVIGRAASLEVQAGMLAAFSRIVKLGFPLFLVFHIAACFWISFGTHGEFGSTIFAPTHRIGNERVANQYISALFWSLSVLSNTSIPEGSPTTSVESLFCVVAMTAGLGAISYVVGAIGALMEQKNLNRRIHESRLRDIVKFMEFNEIPSDIQRKVTSYMEYKWTANGGFEPEVMFDTLPRSLNQSLSTALARDIVDQVPFFAIFSEDALNAIVLEMRSILCMPNEYIYKMGRASDLMYFVRVGAILAIAHSPKYDYELNDESNNCCVFGVETLSTPDAFGVYESLALKKYIISVRASSFADLYTLSATAMMKALEPFPSQLALIKEQIHFNSSKERKAEMANVIQSAIQEEKATPSLHRRSISIPTGVHPLAADGVHGGIEGKTITSVVQNMLIKPKEKAAVSGMSSFKIASKLVYTAKKARLRTTLATAISSKNLASTLENSSTKWKDFKRAVYHFRGTWVLYPTSPTALIWLFLVTSFNVYNLIAIPFRIVFIPFWLTPAMMVIDYTGDCVYLVDIFLNFHTAYMNHGQLVSHLAEIGHAYKKHSLQRHILASLPLDFFMLAFGPSAFVRVNRLLRMPDVANVVRNSSNSTDQPWKTLTKKVGALLLEFLFIAHFVTCGYFLFTNFDGYGTEENRWLPPEYLNDETDPQRKYLYGLFFSYDMLLRLGVNIVPRTPMQIIFSILVLLNGVLVVAQLIGSFSSFLQVYDHGESQFKDRMQQLTQYLLKNRVPKRIRLRVLDFYKFQWNDLGGVDMNNILRMLPDQLRSGVMFSLGGPVIDRVPDLKKAPVKMRQLLSCALQFECYSEGTTVFENGDPAESMYFVRRGRVDIIIDLAPEPAALYDVVLPGRYFGENAVFSDDRKRTMLAMTKENTHIIRLARSDFLDIIERFPEFKEQFFAQQALNAAEK